MCVRNLDMGREKEEILKISLVKNKMKSKAIKTITYDSTRKDLIVKFRSGKEYIYTPAQSELFEDFVSSDSKGEFFNQQVKDNPSLKCMKVV